MIPNCSSLGPVRTLQLEDDLEAARDGRKLVTRFDETIGPDAKRTHFFFSRDVAGASNVLNRVKIRLSGIEGWVEEIPPEICPTIKGFNFKTQSDCDLLLFVKLCYLLASKFERSYFSRMPEWGFYGEQYREWNELRRPTWVSNEHLCFEDDVAAADISRWTSEVNALPTGGYFIPDIVATYPRSENIIGDFLSFSAVAVDTLIYAAQHLIGNKPAARGKTVSTKRRRNRANNKRTLTDVRWLAQLLFQHHDPSAEHPNSEPLSAIEIGERLNWFKKTNLSEVDENRVHRRMKLLWGERPQQKYRRFCRKNAAVFSRGGSVGSFDEKRRLDRFLEAIEGSEAATAAVKEELRDHLDSGRLDSRLLYRDMSDYADLTVS